MNKELNTQDEPPYCENHKFRAAKQSRLLNYTGGKHRITLTFFVIIIL